MENTALFKGFCAENWLKQRMLEGRDHVFFIEIVIFPYPLCTLLVYANSHIHYQKFPAFYTIEHPGQFQIFQHPESGLYLVTFLNKVWLIEIDVID